VKIFADATYTAATTVRHQGVVLSFTATDASQIVYSVLDLGHLQSSSQRANDDNAWTDPRPVVFPTDIRPAGMNLLAADTAAVQTEQVPRSISGAFQVYSDGDYVYIFRASAYGTVYVNRFVLVPGSTSLQPKWETRFQRSRKKDIPASGKDTVSFKDMDGQVFQEPTTELTFVRLAPGGGFTVFSLPSDVPGEATWYIISLDPPGSRLVWYSMPRSRDGLFDVTSPRIGRSSPELRVPPAVAPLVLTGQPAALVYAYQELLTDQYGRTQRAKRAARVMLACTARAGSTTGLVVLDLPVAPDGSLLDGDDTPALCLSVLGAAATVEQGNVLPVVGRTARWSVVRGGLVPVAEGAFDPFLLDGADGLIHVYFRNNAYGLSVLHYDSATARACYVLPLDRGRLVFTGVTAGSHLNTGVSIVVTDGSDTDLCDVAIRADTLGAALVEAWHDVPRDLTGFAQVLTGQTAPDTFDYAAQSGTSPIAHPAWAYGQDGRPTDSLWTLAEGVAGISFGPSGYLVVDDTGLATGSGPHSVEAWIWLTVLPHQPTDILTLGGSETVGELWQVQPDGVLICGAREATARVRTLTPLPTGAWTHVATTYDDTTYTLYRNGAAQGNGLAIPLTLQDSALYVGGTQPGQDGLLNGAMRDLRLWAAVRSAEQIRGGVARRLDGHEPDLVGYWPMSEGKGSTVPDHVQPSHDLADGSRLFSVSAEAVAPEQVASARVPNTALDEPDPARVGVDCSWRASTAGVALAFDGSASHVTAQLGDPAALDETADAWTVETWAKLDPLSDLSATLLEYRSATSLLRLGLEANRAAFALSSGRNRLITDEAYGAANAFDTTGYTVEAWYQSESAGGVLRFGYPEFRIYCYANSHPQTYEFHPNSFFFYVGFQTSLHIVELRRGWNHFAVCVSPVQDQYGTRSMTVYANGEQCASANGVRGLPPPDDLFFPPTWSLAVGAMDESWWITDEGLWPLASRGAVSELRIWAAPRTQAQVREHMLSTLHGDEPDLVAYYPFTDGHGTTIANAVASHPGFPLKYDTGEWSVPPGSGEGHWVTVTNAIVAETAGERVVATGMLRGTGWVHIAATYTGSHALNLGGKDSIDCGPATTLNLSNALTVEAWISPAPDGRTVGPIVGQWADLPQDSTFVLGVDPRGKPYVDIVVGAEATRITVVGAAALPASPWTHLAATYDAESVILGGQLRFQCRVALYVDGQAAAEPVQVQTASGTLNPAHINLRIATGGSAGDTARAAHYTGRLKDVRIWNRALNPTQIARICADPIDLGDRSGLAGWWPLDDGQGRTAQDKAGTNPGTLSSTRPWERSSFGSQWQIYLDGVPVQGITSRSPGSYTGDPHLTIGATLPDETITTGPQQQFRGELDEIRIWKAARTQQQLNDLMYRPLAGSEEGLAGYWPIDAIDEVANGTIRDATGRGNIGTSHGAVVVASDAPLGEEGPEVCDALARPPMRGAPATGALAVIEYGDLETTPTQAVSGVMRRCYTFISDGALHLVTGFEVGELLVQFIGQVQTAPTLIGYIEGAPPVPSENLTIAGTVYGGTSSVSLGEMDNTVRAFSVSRNTGFDLSGDVKAGVYVAARESVGVAVESQIFAADTRVMLHSRWEISQGWLDDASVSLGTNRTLTSSLALRGRWENDKKVAHPDLGRRWLPVNHGYALVKSRTADLYALQLKSTNVTVAYQILPDPNIPEDWNILTFQIAPEYVKNGTLDGYVGFNRDEDHENLAQGEKGSYYNPLEAYQLKDRIEKEEAALRSFYEQYNRGAGYTQAAAATQGAGQFDAAKRSLVNTYVWTADGGLYTEEEQTTDTHEQSEGCSFHFLQQGGIYVDLRISGGYAVEADLLAGGHIDVTISKRAESSSSFGLSVNLAGESNLDGDDGNPVPGKVDAYRFMTFYLAPAGEHRDAFFQTVVDRKWLETSRDPNAVALRAARANPNKVWRVLHRVTYVSRIPGIHDQAPPPTDEEASSSTARPDGTGNEALIALVREQLGGRPANLTDLAVALDTIFHSPAARDAIGAWWPDFVVRALPAPENRTPDDTRASRTFTRIRTDAVTYLGSYYRLI
jgi:hypothetical protein